LGGEAISRRAGQAKGTFYLYFDTKDAFLLELLRGYVAFEFATFPAFLPSETAFQAYLRRIGWYERTFARTAGVLRCMLQMSETEPKIRRLWHDRNAGIVDRVEAETIARLAAPVRDRQLLRLVIRTVGTMVD